MSRKIRAVVIAAQQEEVAPFLSLLQSGGVPRALRVPTPVGHVWESSSSKGKIVVVQCGIGQAAAASSLTWVLSRYTPKTVMMIGTAGGLSENVHIGDIVIGTNYAYATADATAFGYVIGQVPGQPETFKGHEATIAAASTLPAPARGAYHCGLMLSSDAFVGGHNIGAIRKNFPEALSTDMESTACAQVAHVFKVPYAAVRCISDNCDPNAADVYSMSLNQAARQSAEVALQILDDMVHPVAVGPVQRFTKETLTLGLLYVLARVHHLESGDLRLITPEEREAMKVLLEEERQPELEDILQRIAGARRAITDDPNLTLTAKQYDAERALITDEASLARGRGRLAWPPTSQTIIKRFNGYWNDALLQTGIHAQSGRKRGGLKFTDADCVLALRSFASWAARMGTTPSYQAYQEWATQIRHTNKVPSGAAVRQRYGSWSAATRAANI